MKNIQTFSKRHPLMAYFALAFAISWGAVILVIGPGDVLDTEAQTGELLPVVMVAMYAGPSVAGLLMTGLIQGRAGFGALLSRLLKWRVDVRWYAVALLIAPFSVLVSLLPLSLFSPTFRPGILATEEPLSLLLFCAALGLMTGFCEELGWTGFAVPRLRLRYGVVATGLIVGVLWGAWHLLVNVWGSAGSSASLSLAIFLPVVLFSFLPPFRVLMVWVADRTGSLLVPVLMHASLITFWMSFTPLEIAGASLVTWYLVWAIVLWSAVAAVVVANRGRLSQPSLRRRMA